jgi:polyhydroxyalkanoate synthesis repressor PhaR
VPNAQRQVRRYPNRKLYDPGARRYVTLEDLASAVAAGEEVQVLDQKSGEDLTNLVLAQVVMEGVKERTARIPRQVLTRLVRFGLGSAKPKAALPPPPPPDLATRAREEAERIVAGLLTRGRLSLEEALGLRQEIAASVLQLAGDAQRGLEQALHGLLDRAEREGGVAPSLQSLKEKLLTLETYLQPGKPRVAARRRSPRTKTKSKTRRQ